MQATLYTDGGSRGPAEETRPGVSFIGVLRKLFLRDVLLSGLDYSQGAPIGAGRVTLHGWANAIHGLL